MQLFSISRKKKPDYEHGVAHKVYENKLNQEFDSAEINQKWCTDFTYMPRPNGSMRYNCSIIDLFDRSAVATLNGSNTTAELAIATLQKALDVHKPGKGIILHSDQGIPTK